MLGRLLLELEREGKLRLRDEEDDGGLKLREEEEEGGVMLRVEGAEKLREGAEGAGGGE